MRITEPGPVTDCIRFMGLTESCVYLVDGGGEYVLIGGGLAYVIPDLMDQLTRAGIQEEKIRRLLILHAHFDHCGMNAFLKKALAPGRNHGFIRGSKAPGRAPCHSNHQ